MPSHYTQDLLQLVRHMSGPEKSYFKKMAKRHAHQNQALHLRLFDLIENSDHNDEEIFRKKLNLATRAHYSSLKKYLTREILDTIIFLQRNDHPDIQLQFYVLQIEILLERNLTVLAQKLYKQAIQLANQYDAFSMRMKLLMLHRRLLEHASYKEYFASSDEIDEQLRKNAEYQRLLEKNQLLFERLNMLSKNSLLRLEEIQLQDVQQLEKELGQMKIPFAEAPLLGLHYYINKMMCAYLNVDFEEAATYATAALACWEAHPHFIATNLRSFLKSADITLYNDFARKQITDADLHCERYHRLASVHVTADPYHQHWLLLSFNTRLKIFHKTGRYDQVEELMNREAAGVLQAAHNVLSPAEQLGVLGSLTISYFVLERWADAEDIMVLIKERNRQVQREDVLHFSMLFYLLILFEQKEWYRLDSAAEAAYHYLYTRKKLRPFEKDLMLFIKKMPAARINGEAQTVMSAFLQKLEAYTNDPVKQLYFLYFNYYGWLESKVQGLSYRQYMQQKIATEAGVAAD